jgi:hypothetical protein
MRFTPEQITTLEPNEVFVFGSNRAGVHGAGAAKLAVEKFGAHFGEGEGVQGRSYAFPTKDENIQTLPLEEIEISVQRLLKACRMAPSKTFLLTKVGCGLAGLTVKDVATLFKNYTLPKNLVLPMEFHEVIYPMPKPRCRCSCK